MKIKTTNSTEKIVPQEDAYLPEDIRVELRKSPTKAAILRATVLVIVGVLFGVLGHYLGVEYRIKYRGQAISDFLDSQLYTQSRSSH